MEAGPLDAKRGIGEHMVRYAWGIVAASCWHALLLAKELPRREPLSALRSG